MFFFFFFNSKVDIVRPPYPIAFELLYIASYICASNLCSVSNYTLAIMCMLDNSFLSREQTSLQTLTIKDMTICATHIIINYACTLMYRDRVYNIIAFKDIMMQDNQTIISFLGTKANTDFVQILCILLFPVCNICSLLSPQCANV